MAAAGSALVAAESILALTPVVIKKTPLDPISAIWSRVLSSSALGYLLADDRTVERKDWLKAGALGYTNLLHVASSYESFRHLPAGQAMSLLYTYPLWILVLNNVFRNEPITGTQYGLMTTAAAGSVILNLDPGKAAPTALGVKAHPVYGIVMGLVMAFTESIMHVIMKALDWKDPSKGVWVMSSTASVWLAIFLAIQSIWNGGVKTFGLQSGTWWDATLLTGFNALTIFSGYWLRFFAVPRLSTVTYSILSYAGLLASYLYGLFFLGERPGWWSVIGAIMILVSGLLLQLPTQHAQSGPAAGPPS